jgi:hypothetical protein
MGWHFGEYMGMAEDPIPCDSEYEVMTQFRVIHHTGDVAGKPIEIESDAEEELPTHMERGECSRPKMERGTTDVVYPSIGVLDTGVSRSTCSWAPSMAQLRPRGGTTTEANGEDPHEEAPHEENDDQNC